jgi:uncharacterized Tic20 family protein
MQPSEDERVLAALSHASIVANVVSLAGMIATSLIWTMQRERSPYVGGHALQALVYQGLVLLISLFLALFGGLCLALSLLPVMVRPDLYRSSPPSYSIWIGVLALLALIGFGMLALIYGLYGAYQAYRGRPFRYLLVGRIVRPPRPASAPAAGPAPTPAPVADPAPAPTSEPPADAGLAPIVDVPLADAAPAAEPSPEPPADASPPAPKRRGRRSAGDGDS